MRSSTITELKTFTVVEELWKSINIWVTKFCKWVFVDSVTNESTSKDKFYQHKVGGDIWPGQQHFSSKQLPQEKQTACQKVQTHTSECFQYLHVYWKHNRKYRVQIFTEKNSGMFVMLVTTTKIWSIFLGPCQPSNILNIIRSFQKNNGTSDD